MGYALNDAALLTFHGSYNDAKGLYASSLTREQFDADPSQNPNTGADSDYESEDTLGALVYEQQLGRHEFMAKMEVQACDYQLYWGFLTRMESMQAHPEASMTLNHDIAGMTNKLVIGGEDRYHDYEVDRYTASSFIDITAINQDFTRKDISYAGYVQDELSVTDAFTVTAGIRYDFFYLEQNAHIAGSDSWDQEKGDFSPKLGLTYQICDEINLFAGFNSGIKSPVRLPVYYTQKKIGRAEFYLVANNLFDESAVGDGSGNLGSETLYPIAGLNTVFGLNVEF